MYIKQIELENFKNFKEKKIIELHKGLNVIFGANGAGKSNILDSINFIYDKEDLRIKNDIDFFNSLSNNPKLTVKIVLDNTEIEKTLEKDASDTIKTSYYLNNKLSSKDEISELLKEIKSELKDDCGMSLNVEDVKNYALGLKKQSQNIQIIAVSDRKPILEAADKIINL